MSASASSLLDGLFGERLFSLRAVVVSAAVSVGAGSIVLSLVGLSLGLPRWMAALLACSMTLLAIKVISDARKSKLCEAVVWILLLVLEE
jgi:hypothetical protein